MAAFATFLESIYRDGNDGKQFERFVKWFLKFDPEWSTQVDEVWSWDEWREDINAALPGVFKTISKEDPVGAVEGST